MVASHASVLHSPRKPHLHIAGQHCPFCEQEIPADKLEEISGRIAAREQERLSEGLSRLREQYGREKAETDAKSKAELEQVKRDAAAEAKRLKADADAREAAARAEAREAASKEAQAKLEAAESARKEADKAKVAAEDARAKIAGQLEQVKAESAAAVAKTTQEAAAREARIRAEAARAAEDAMKEKVAAAALAKSEAERAKSQAERALHDQLVTADEQMANLKETHASEINLQREALEKDKITSVNAERAKNLETQMRLESQLQDMQRKLQKKTADELGEGAERELHDALKAAFENDKIRRVEKGALGADIVHEIVHNGNICGKIVYDSKNRNIWKSEYASKLRADQIAEKADHAILSSNKFPKDARQLHLQDHVIIACPARVLVLAELLRGHIIQTFELRISNDKREEKTVALYDFITSERCGQLLDSVETLIRKLEQIEIDEEKTHRKVWKNRGELLRGVLKVNGDLCFEIDRIIGTTQAPE